MALGSLGKFLIAVSLCFQAYILFSDSNTINLFNKQLNTLLTKCDCISTQVAQLLQQHLRFVIVGLLASSALMVISRAIFFKMLVLMGLISLLVIKHFPIKKLPPFDNVQFWEAVAIVGGIVYLMGADAERKEPAKVKEE